MTGTMPGSVRRPFAIALLMWIGVLQGLVNIAGGLFILIDRNDPDLVFQSGMTPDHLLWAGLWSIIIGLFVIMVALYLGSGSEVARVLFAIVAALNTGVGIWGLFALQGEQQFAAAISATLGVIVLYLLFNERSERFFEDRTPM